MHILLPNYTNFKNIRLFENLVIVIMSSRENMSLIARTPYTIQAALFGGLKLNRKANCVACSLIST